MTRFTSVVLVAALAAASGVWPDQAGAQARRKAGQQRPDSLRLTLVSAGQRFVVADDDEQSGCNTAKVAKDGSERISGWVWAPIASGPGVGLRFARQTNMPICSYKAKAGTSEFCQMRLTGRMRVDLNFEEREDADDGLHLHVWWKPAFEPDSVNASATVDVGNCMETRNEQRDGDLTGPMASDFRAAYLGVEGRDGIPNSGPIIFPLAKRGWLAAPVSLKSKDGEFALQIAR